MRINIPTKKWVFPNFMVIEMITAIVILRNVVKSNEQLHFRELIILILISYLQQTLVFIIKLRM